MTICTVHHPKPPHRLGVSPQIRNEACNKPVVAITAAPFLFLCRRSTHLRPPLRPDFASGVPHPSDHLVPCFCKWTTCNSPGVTARLLNVHPKDTPPWLSASNIALKARARSRTMPMTCQPPSQPRHRNGSAPSSSRRNGCSSRL